MERIEQDETIDLQKLAAIIFDRKKLFGGIVAAFTLVALIISLVLPKEYTSQVTVQSSSSGVDLSGAAAAMAAIAGRSSMPCIGKDRLRSICRPSQDITAPTRGTLTSVISSP